MRRVEYYQCHIQGDNPALEEINGTRQPVEDIATRALASMDIVDRSDFGISPSFDPLCRTKTSQWERSLATMIYAITGQNPAREELKIGRRIVESLSRDFKREHVDESFILGPLAYTLAFQKTTEADFQADANTVRDTAQFLEQVAQHTDTNVIFNSLLCGHRVDSAIKKNSLIDSLPIDKVRRTLRLVTGLGRSAQQSPLTVVWYQQQPGRYASSNMFPTVFERYVTDAEIPALFARLAHYDQQLRTLFDEEKSDHVTYSLENLDAITEPTLSSLGVYTDWQSVGLDSPQFDRETNQMVAITQPEIARFAAQYGNRYEPRVDEYVSQNIMAALRSDSETNLVDVAESIHWFYESLTMSLAAKALYEVSLSKTWGRINGASGAVGVGIDRDHTQQRQIGYALGQQQAGIPVEQQVPLLYGRFKKDEKPAGLLSAYNVRQFWT